MSEERTKESLELERKRDEEGHQLEPAVTSRFQALLLVATCTSAMILNTSSSTAVSIALPSIGRDLNVSVDDLQWTISAFSLSNGCLLIFFGRLADLYGRKKAFLSGVFTLGVFGLACGFARNVVALNILRGLQGLGPAAMIPAALGILAHTFPPSRARSTAFATFAGGAPVGGAIGTQIGGILTQYAAPGWRAPFYLTSGLALLCFIGGMLSIPPDRPSEEKDKRVDWIGAALVTAGLVLITFVLGDGELAPNGWKTPYIIVFLILGVIFLGIFIWWQHYLESNRRDGQMSHRPPLMKLSLWTRANGKFAVMQCVAFLEWSSFISFMFWAQLYYQDYEGLSVILTAVRFLPMTVTGILCNVFVALVVGRIDVVFLVVFGTTLTSVAGLLFAVINPSATYWAFGFPAAVVSVFGADFVMASGSIFVAKVSQPHEQSLAGGLFQTLTQLGTAFGLAISTIVHNRVLTAQSPGLSTAEADTEASPSAQLHAYQAAQWTCFAFAILGSVLAAIFLRGVGIVGHRQNSKAGTSADDIENQGANETQGSAHTEIGDADAGSNTVGEKSRREERWLNEEKREEEGKIRETARQS